jgi:hypothetical protein
MANSDIKLMDDGDGWVKVEAGDLNVDGGTARRKGNTTQYKRALVHDFDDGLTVNWGNDYSGGVTINGLKKIATQPSQPLSIESGCITLHAGAAEFIGALIHLKCEPEQAGGVKITGDVQFINKLRLSDEVTFLGPATFAGPAKVTKTIPPPRPGMGPIMMQYDIFDQISQLRGDVQALKEKVGIA